MLLVLPDVLFNPLFHLLGIFPKEGLMSPGQMDLTERRKSMVHWHFSELVDVSWLFPSSGNVLLLQNASVSLYHSDASFPCAAHVACFIVPYCLFFLWRGYIYC
jgi:hypothetical protein